MFVSGRPAIFATLTFLFVSCRPPWRFWHPLLVQAGQAGQASRAGRAGWADRSSQASPPGWPAWLARPAGRQGHGDFGRPPVQQRFDFRFSCFCARTLSVLKCREEPCQAPHTQGCSVPVQCVPVRNMVCSTGKVCTLGIAQCIEESTVVMHRGWYLRYCTVCN